VSEIGSGFGGWSKKLQGHYKAYTGAEIMPERVAHARELHENEHAKFERITGPDWDMMRTFDVVFTVTVIQHLEMDKAEIVMRQIERHLKSTGKVLLVERHIYDCSLDEAERMYDNTAAHMIPKPLYLLKEAAPSLTWEQAGEYNYILRKTL
jgi:2-polyprenyl-3-methyl-5-hydroxy-6-metoxy-1,4-benzoquinol methylase